MQLLSGLTYEEREELWNVILPDYEAAIGRLWGLHHMNYAWLGNEFSHHQGHGHLHLIPRYSELVYFNGLEFRDGQWGKNYAPYPKVELSQEAIFCIRDSLRRELCRT